MFYTQISYMNNFESSINGLRVGNLKLVLKCQEVGFKFEVNS